MSYLIVGLVLFLVGFYCGKIWVTYLEGKTISFSVKTICLVVFILIVIATGMFFLNLSRKGNNFPGPDPDNQTLSSPTSN